MNAGDPKYEAPDDELVRGESLTGWEAEAENSTSMDPFCSSRAPAELRIVDISIVLISVDGRSVLSTRVMSILALREVSIMLICSEGADDYGRKRMVVLEPVGLAQGWGYGVVGVMVQEARL